MGRRGPRGLKHWTIPGSDGWLDQILGPVVETPKTKTMTMRNWKNGGREAILARWRKRDSLPWAYWRDPTCIPRKLFNYAVKHYQTDKAAIEALGIEVPHPDHPTDS